MLKERVLYHQWWFATPPPSSSNSPHQTTSPPSSGHCFLPRDIYLFHRHWTETQKSGKSIFFIQCIKFCINKGSICECWIGCCTLPLFFSSKEINSFLLFGYIWLHIDFRKRNKYHHYLLLSLSLCRSDPQCGTECCSGRIRGMTNGETSHGPCLLPLVAIIPTYHIYH